MSAALPMPAQPVQSVYNPTPPVRPVAKKTAGCMGIIGAAIGLMPVAWFLLAAIVR
jgi:hypothetical protein